MPDAEEKNLFQSPDTKCNNVKKPVVRNVQHLNLVCHSHANSPHEGLEVAFHPII